MVVEEGGGVLHHVERERECPRDMSVPDLCILGKQTKTCYFLLNAVLPCLSWTSPVSNCMGRHSKPRRRQWGMGRDLLLLKVILGFHVGLAISRE